MSSSQRILLGSLVCVLLSVPARAQDTSSSSTSSGAPTVTTEIKSAKVVYVSGNDLVVRTEDGQVKHFVVPDDKTMTVDGKQMTVHDLQPGMELTRTITTTTTPKTITTVRTIKGAVWYVAAPSSVILTLGDSKNRQYKVPKGQMFEVDGQEQDVFALRKGMIVSATVLTETPEIVSRSTRNVTGTAPAPPPTPVVPSESALLIEEPITTPTKAAAEAPPASLPKTASNVPLVGLLGLLCLGAGLVLRAVRS